MVSPLLNSNNNVLYFFQVLNLLQKGNKARTMEATAANITSSRSHAVLQVSVRQVSSRTGLITEGKLYLIDLAGSERASNTKV